MWTIQPDQIAEQLKTSDSRGLARFLAALLHAECWKHGVSTAAISVNFETTLADGGVDARNTQAIGPADGYVPFGSPL